MQAKDDKYSTIIWEVRKHILEQKDELDRLLRKKDEADRQLATVRENTWCRRRRGPERCFVLMPAKMLQTYLHVNALEIRLVVNPRVDALKYLLSAYHA